jgi:hypothetical protein
MKKFNKKVMVEMNGNYLVCQDCIIIAWAILLLKRLTEND